MVVPVLSADMVAGDDGDNETAQNAPGSSLTLSVGLSSCQALMEKHQGSLSDSKTSRLLISYTTHSAITGSNNSFLKKVTLKL